MTILLGYVQLGNVSSHMEILGCGLDKEKQTLSDKGKKKRKKKI